MKNILIFGDSNTWGYDVVGRDPVTGEANRFDWDTRWPGVVQKTLGAEYRILENALNGRTCVWDDPYMPLRNGLPALQAVLDVNAPLDAVVIHLGINETKTMFSLSAGRIAAGAEMLVKEAQKALYQFAAPKVLLVAPAPVDPKISEKLFADNFGPGSYEVSLGLGKAYAAVAERTGCEFLDAADLGFTLNPVDGLHYCAGDHEKLGKAVSKKLKEMLG